MAVEYFPAESWLKHPQEMKKIHMWKRGKPFVFNPRGLLVHRVRSFLTFKDKFYGSWHVAKYYCGNSAANGRSKTMELYDVPPEHLLVCARCEAIALSQGQKSAAEIAGRHVHIGTVKAHRLCCRPEN